MIGPRTNPPTTLIRIDANYDTTTDVRSQASIIQRIIQAITSLNTTESVVLVGSRGRPVIAPRDSFARIRTNNESLQFLELATALGQTLGHTTGPSLVSLPTVQIPAYRVTPQICLLENLMFDPREMANDQVLARQLGAIGHRYFIDDIRSLNDSVSSIASVPKCIPTELSEPAQRELSRLDRLVLSPNHPFVAVVGGNQVPSKLRLIRRLVDSADEILVGGAVANAFLAGRGVDVQRTVVSGSDADAAKQLDGIVGDRLTLPTDFVWRAGRIMDIGPNSRTRYARSIAEAQSILFAGTVGVTSTQLESFHFGSVALAEAMRSSLAATKVVVGDETVALMQGIGVSNDELYCQGDTASVEYLAGQKLVGIEAIQRSRYARTSAV